MTAQVLILGVDTQAAWRLTVNVQSAPHLALNFIRKMQGGQQLEPDNVENELNLRYGAAFRSAGIGQFMYRADAKPMKGNSTDGSLAVAVLLAWIGNACGLSGALGRPPALCLQASTEPDEAPTVVVSSAEIPHQGGGFVPVQQLASKLNALAAWVRERKVPPYSLRVAVANELDDLERAAWEDLVACFDKKTPPKLTQIRDLGDVERLALDAAREVIGRRHSARRKERLELEVDQIRSRADAFDSARSEMRRLLKWIEAIQLRTTDLKLERGLTDWPCAAAHDVDGFVLLDRGRLQHLSSKGLLTSVAATVQSAETIEGFGPVFVARSGWALTVLTSDAWTEKATLPCPDGVSRVNLSNRWLAGYGTRVFFWEVPGQGAPPVELVTGTSSITFEELAGLYVADDGSNKACVLGVNAGGFWRFSLELHQNASIPDLHPFAERGEFAHAVQPTPSGWRLAILSRSKLRVYEIPCHGALAPCDTFDVPGPPLSRPLVAWCGADDLTALWAPRDRAGAAVGVRVSVRSRACSPLTFASSTPITGVVASVDGEQLLLLEKLGVRMVAARGGSVGDLIPSRRARPKRSADHFVYAEGVYQVGADVPDGVRISDGPVEPRTFANNAALFGALRDLGGLANIVAMGANIGNSVIARALIAAQSAGEAARVDQIFKLVETARNDERALEARLTDAADIGALREAVKSLEIDEPLPDLVPDAIHEAIVKALEGHPRFHDLAKDGEFTRALATFRSAKLDEAPLGAFNWPHHIDEIPQLRAIKAAEIRELRAIGVV